ncbi:hypothetical protein POM88_028880 [Heracleum sosnowskyi]|uniref:Uncharacterized protein n=1 Tax=Heracleum sosnowskyi TaxID=360622 RepID=A0AAD8HUF6_9APIA|nr:hypothetical protein POM88_028880 [Heracleum sosnowskyi]
MTLYNGFREILKVQKLRRIVSYTGFYCFTAVVTYAYTNNTTRAGYSRADQYYASYPAGTELLTDAAKCAKIISRLKAGEEKTMHALKSFCWRCKEITLLMPSEGNYLDGL